MRASSAMSMGTPKCDNVGVPKKSALASGKKPRMPGRHISFAPAPTFFLIAAIERSPASMLRVSECLSKVRDCNVHWSCST